jgi:hypothetical protein
MAREHIDDGDLRLLETLPTLLGGTIDQAVPVLDPNALARRQQQVLETLYPDPNIRRLVPQADVERINLDVARQWRDDVEQGVLYDLGDDVHGGEYDQVIERVTEAAMRPPSARAAWLEGMNLRSTSSTDALLIEVLDGQRAAAVEQTLRSAPPSRVLQAYVFEEGDTTGAARRWIEAQHADGWRGAPSEDPRELEAVQALRRAITEERQGRIPPAVAAARHTLAKAADLLKRIQLTTGLAPRRPADR